MRVSLRKIVEGRTNLFVPSASLTMSEPPTTPFFFNPAASVNRDISVAITEAVTGRTFCDSLAGVGARGVRLANELSRRMDVTMVDFNASALRVAEKNARANSLKRCEFVRSEANTFLFSRFGRDSKFDFVDIDPFGTPVPYIQGGFGAAADGGVVSLTATDTAVLCGVYPEVCRRRYSSLPLKNEFKHETALRILLNTCRRIAGMNDMGIEPVAAHSTRHYLRVYARARVGATQADRSRRQEGFIASCEKCGERGSSSLPMVRCDGCGARIISAGPLWRGPLIDPRVIGAASNVSRRSNLIGGAKALEALLGVEYFPPFSYSVERISSALKVPGVSQSEVMRRLASNGYRVMRQPFEKTGFKTEATYGAVAETVSAVSRDAGAAPAPLHARPT
jgi:tRNA (guanine26-N2/guanine27-N2)-dimethyltransferase